MSNAIEKTADAALFLSELGKGIPAEERVMVGYAGDATSQKGKNGKMNNSGWTPLPHRLDREIEWQKNCYVCISASIKTPHPFYPDAFRYWRGEESFGHGLALMVDDIPLDASHAGIGSKGERTVQWFASRLPPTVVVETSPGNTQLFYFMREPVSELAYFKDFLVSFADQVLDKGGDHTIRDVSRYGRLPVGINNKKLPDGKLKYPVDCGKPFRVRQVSADYSLRYTPEGIAAAFDMTIKRRAKAQPSVLDEETIKGNTSIEELWLRLLVERLSKAKQGEYAGGEVRRNASGRYRIKCPFSFRHSTTDGYGAYFRGPVSGAEFEYVAGCAHDVCRRAHKWGWSDLVDLIIVAPYVEKLAEIDQFYSDKTFETFSEFFS